MDTVNECKGDGPLSISLSVAAEIVPLDYVEHPLELWRQRHGRSRGWMCDRLKCSEPTYYKWTVARGHKNALVPRAKSMKLIVVLTAGAVEPNDFYPVHEWNLQAVSMMQANATADLRRDIALDQVGDNS